MSLGLLNAGDLFLGVRHRTIVFLVVLLDELVVLLLIVELLAIAGDTGLAGIDWALDLSYHPEEVRILFGVSDVIEPGVLQRLLTCESLCWIHLEKTDHETQSLLGQTAHVALFKGLWLTYVREL